MAFLQQNSIESLIIKSLKDTGSSGPDIISAVKKHKPTLTDQAIYVVLRRLISDTILYKRDKTYSINRLWLTELYNFASSRLNTLQRAEAREVLDLEDGDKITYQFKNPHLMDIYWEHIFDTLLAVHDKTIPIIVYHPHNWFLYARPESEKFFLQQFTKQKIRALFTTCGKTPLDLKFKNTWRSEYLQINCGNSYGFKNGYYVNILGDIIIEVFTDATFSKEIEKIYTLSDTDESFKQFMKTVSSKRYKTKLVISKDKKKSDLLFKKITKDFFVPQSYSLSAK